MKQFCLEEKARRTLFEMGMWHPHARVRRRAQALVRLAQGVTQTQVARQFGVHLDSVRNWMTRWQSAGLVGLYPEPVPGRPRKLSPVVAERLRQVVLTEGGTVRDVMQSGLAQAARQRAGLPAKAGPSALGNAGAPVTRGDVISFFDRLASSITLPTVVVLDNAGIHHGAPMRQRQPEWERRGLQLMYLPPYCPELNAIEILWKHAKYYWRRFLTLTGTALHEEVDALMRGFGTDYTIAFR